MCLILVTLLCRLTPIELVEVVTQRSVNASIDPPSSKVKRIIRSPHESCFSTTSAKPSRNSLPTTIRDFKPRLQFPIRSHETPSVLPVLARSVVLDFPGLVEGFKPINHTRSN